MSSIDSSLKVNLNKWVPLRKIYRDGFSYSNEKTYKAFSITIKSTHNLLMLCTFHIDVYKRQGFDRGKAKLTIKNVNKELSSENRSFKDKKKTSTRDDKKGGSKKWNNKSSNSSSDEGETTERKYFK